MGYSNALPTKNRTPYLPALVSSSRISSRTCAAVIGWSSVDSSENEASSLSSISAFSDLPAAFAAVSSFSLSSLVSLTGYGWIRWSSLLIR